MYAELCAIAKPYQDKPWLTGQDCVDIFEELQKMYEPPPHVMLPQLIESRATVVGEIEKRKAIVQGVFSEPEEIEQAKAELFDLEAALQAIDQDLVKVKAELAEVELIGEGTPSDTVTDSGAADAQEPLKEATKAKGSKSRKKKDEIPGMETRELPDGSAVFAVGQNPPVGGYPTIGSEDDPGTYNYWLEVAKRVGVDSDKVKEAWGGGGDTHLDKQSIEQLGKTLCAKYPKIDVYHWCLNFIKEKSISASILAAVWRKLDINWKDDTGKIKHELAAAIAVGGMTGLNLAGMDMDRAAEEIGDVYLSQRDSIARYKAQYDRRCERAKQIQGFIERYLAPDFAHWIEENKEPGTKYVQTDTSRWQLRISGSVEYISDEKKVEEWLAKQTPEMLAGLGITREVVWKGATDAKLHKAGCDGVSKSTGLGVEKVCIE